MAGWEVQMLPLCYVVPVYSLYLSMAGFNLWYPKLQPLQLCRAYHRLKWALGPIKAHSFCSIVLLKPQLRSLITALGQHIWWLEGVLFQSKREFDNSTRSFEVERCLICLKFSPLNVVCLNTLMLLPSPWLPLGNISTDKMDYCSRQDYLLH